MGEATSFKRAGVPPHIVDRPRLTALLDGASARVVLLVAPAGYGKTTLARQWFGGRSVPTVWYRATRSSADVGVLASDLARLGSVVGLQCRSVKRRLRGTTAPNEEATTLGALLAVDFEAWPADTWLVIDDYHAISSEPAEAFLAAALDSDHLRVMITSRRRPRWIATKDVLYGNVFEVGQSALAMNHAEAAAVLHATSNKDRLAGLVALAEGWPAVIGLASLTTTASELIDRDIPEALYDFFAEELYRELGSEAQRDLCVLALASAINSRLVFDLFGSRGEELLAETERRGILTRQEHYYEFHPLLRQFFLLKLEESHQAYVQELAPIICRWEIAEHRLDEALQLADRCGLQSIILETIDDNLDEMLTQGKIATVEAWLKMGRRQDPTSPTVLRAEMEVAFRRHDWDGARAHAMRLTALLPSDDPHLSRALHRLGQIGHLDDRYEDAVLYLEKARAVAQTRSDLRAALSSAFLVASDHGQKERARQILSDLKTVPDPNAEDLLRLSQAEIHLAGRWGGVEQELRRHSSMLSLVEHATDPVVATGFLQTYGSALALSARYDEALEIARREVNEAESSGLDWVMPHALQLRAMAEWGVGDYGRSLKTVKEAFRLSDNQDDIHGRINAAVLVARIDLAQGSAQRALDVTALELDRQPGPSMLGDFVAIRALAFALSGDNAAALRLADESEALTDHVDTRVRASFVRAIVDLRTRTEAGPSEATSAAFRAVGEAEAFDGFVLAYRSYPPLLKALVGQGDESARACRTHISSADRRLAERAGLAGRSKLEISGDKLTQREREVLALVRRGLSNREIASTLWIAESTAKVHVRNVLRKLGARSRAEAASLTNP